MRPPPPWAVTGALAAAALGLRLPGIGFGLPLLSNLYVRPDESLLVVPAVELLARHGNPGHVGYPALMIEALSALFHLLHRALAAAGAAHPSLADDFAADPSRYFLAARLLAAGCGAALAAVVHRLALRFAGPLAAALAAAWYAVSPLAVRESHFGVTDTPMSLLAACAVLAAVKVAEAPEAARAGAALRASALAGLAAAAKYTALAILPAVAVAAAGGTGRRPAQRLRGAAAAVAAAAALFALANPWLVLHPGQLLEWSQTLLRATYRPAHGPALDPGAPQGVSRAALYLRLFPGGWLGLGFGLAGAVAGLRRWRRRREERWLVLLAAAAGLAAVIAPARTLPLRYLAPLLPLAAVLSAAGLEALARAAPPHLRAGVVLAAGLAGVAATLPETVLLDRSLAREDSRTQAGRWITDNVPPGVPVVWLGEPESEPQLSESAASLGRRVAYAERRYGTAAARVIDRAYLLLMRAPAARAAGAREIHRNPRPGSLASPLICVVSARHPLPTVRTNPRLLAAWTRGRVVREEVFGEPPEQVRGLWERYDAFFLPMRPERALQPGPQLRVSLVERAAAAP